MDSKAFRHGIVCLLVTAMGASPAALARGKRWKDYDPNDWKALEESNQCIRKLQREITGPDAARSDFTAATGGIYVAVGTGTGAATAGLIAASAVTLGAAASIAFAGTAVAFGAPLLGVVLERKRRIKRALRLFAESEEAVETGTTAPESHSVLGAIYKRYTRNAWKKGNPMSFQEFAITVRDSSRSGAICERRGSRQRESSNFHNKYTTVYQIREMLENDELNHFRPDDSRVSDATTKTGLITGDMEGATSSTALQSAQAF